MKSHQGEQERVLIMHNLDKQCEVLLFETNTRDYHPITKMMDLVVRILHVYDDGFTLTSSL